MLDMYEQKVLIEYLINAIEYMKNDADADFCLQKIVNLTETVKKAYKIKQISFDLNVKEYGDYNSINDTKKLYLLAAKDIIAHLKAQHCKLKNSKISAKEKTFRVFQKLFMLNDDEINVFKMFCRNELDDICCDVLCLAQIRSRSCSVQSMCQHYLNIKKTQPVIDKLVDIGLLYYHRGRRGFNLCLPNSVANIIENNYSTPNQIYNQFIGSVMKAELKKMILSI